MNAFELVMWLSGYSIRDAKKNLSELSLLSSHDLSTMHAKQARDIAAYHWSFNSMYREKVGSKFPERWEDLPILKKADYQADWARIISRPFQHQSLYTASTSGSSGQPFKFAKDKKAHALTWALIDDRYGWHGLSLSSRQARFYGIPLEPVDRFKETLKDRIMNRERFPVFDLSDRQLEIFLKRLRNGRFDYVYGYANSLLSFADFLQRKGLVLVQEAPSLDLCITTSEMCTPPDRLLLERSFGLKVVDEYGTSEVGLLAFEDSEQHRILSEELLYIEIVDDSGRPVPDGSEGSIVVTDLTNRAMPFVRYAVGDIGIISARRHKSRRVLEALVGRRSDTILLPSGKRSPGLTFYYVAKTVLQSTGVIQEFIVRQPSLNKFVFEMVTKRPLDENESSLLRDKVATYLEPNLEIELKYVSSIPRTALGKHQHFFSELKHDKG